VIRPDGCQTPGAHSFSAPSELVFWPACQAGFRHPGFPDPRIPAKLIFAARCDTVNTYARKHGLGTAFAARGSPQPSNETSFWGTGGRWLVGWTLFPERRDASYHELNHANLCPPRDTYTSRPDELIRGNTGPPANRSRITRTLCALHSAWLGPDSLRFPIYRILLPVCCCHIM